MGAKILYIYKSGRRERLALNRGNYPTEFLYGYEFFKDIGYTVDFIELIDMPPPRTDYANRLLLKLRTRLIAWVGIGFDAPYLWPALKQMNKNDIIMAIPDSIGLGLAFYRRRKNLHRPFVYFMMGLPSGLAKNRAEKPIVFLILKIVYNWLLSSCDRIVVLGRGEFEFLHTYFQHLQEKVIFLPFGVDVKFWKPAKSTGTIRPFVLFVGNDPNRDYELLISIAKKMQDQTFVFVSNQIARENIPDNVTLIDRSENDSSLDDADLRALYQKCTAVIVPIKIQCLQPSGQSVSLQAMACGAPVIISKTPGFWEPGNYIDGKHCIFIEEADVEKWVEKIELLLDDALLREKMKDEGRLLVLEHYSIEKFSKKLEESVKPLLKNNLLNETG